MLQELLSEGFFFSYVVGYFSSCDNRFLGMRFLSALIANHGSGSVRLNAEKLQDEDKLGSDCPSGFGCRCFSHRRKR